MPANRTAKKLLLGREIAHMLARSGTSQAQAAKLIETSQSRMTLIAGGGGAISPGDLALLAQGLGFTDPGYLESLRELRRDNHKRGFWSTGHNRAYREDVRLLIDLENNADHIRWAEVEVVPAMLQTEGYVRAQHADQPPVGDLTVDDVVEARLARQRVLDGPNPATLHVIMSESCLRRQWGDTETMREQREHLVTMSDRENVRLQVVPFDAPPGRRSPMGYRFVLLRVPSPGNAGPLEVATTESPGEIRYMDERKVLDAHEDAWARLGSAALSFADTRAFIRRIGT